MKEKLSHGLVEGITFTKNSKSDMFHNLKLLMQQGKLKIPDYIQNPDTRCKKLFYQLLSIQQVFKGDSEIPNIRHEEGGHDDVVCALALACLFWRVGRPKSRGYHLGGGRI